jgi:hypothetical protein
MKKTFLLGFTALWCGLSVLSAQVTIGADNAPQATLDVIGDTANVHGNAFRLIDGNQRINYVLTSDADGKGTWKPTTIPTYYGNFDDETAGITLYKQAATSWTATKAYIDLPPGSWKVDITLLCVGGHQTTQVDTVVTWVLASLSSNLDPAYLSGLGSASASPELGRADGSMAYRLASAVVSDGSARNMLIGTVIVRNTTAGTKRYYLIGNVNMVLRGHTDGSYPAVVNFALKGWGENSITALPINL